MCNGIRFEVESFKGGKIDVERGARGWDNVAGEEPGKSTGMNLGYC